MSQTKVSNRLQCGVTTKHDTLQLGKWGGMTLEMSECNIGTAAPRENLHRDSVTVTVGKTDESI